MELLKIFKKNIFIFIKVKSLAKKILQKKEGKKEYNAYKLGERVSINNCRIRNNTSIGDDCYLYNVSIEEYSYISMRVNIMNSKIGKFCSIGQGVGICLGRHPSHTFVSTSPVFFSPHKQTGITFADKTYFDEMGECQIGNDVWIGANAIILDNINIGDGAIIGAGSIVTRDIPPFAIVAGCPAKIIKYRFQTDEIDFLLNLKWWDKDVDWIQKNYKDFHDINTFKKKYMK